MRHLSLAAGIFYFEAEEPLAEQLLPAPIDTMGLVLEGSRWIDEMARIRQVFTHDNVVLCYGPQYPVHELTPYETRVGANVDGRSTLAELYRLDPRLLLPLPRHRAPALWAPGAGHPAGG